MLVLPAGEIGMIEDAERLGTELQLLAVSDRECLM
jgi:hypothetical protein